MITLAGPAAQGTALFESHIDTVPAESWLDRALSPAISNGHVYGRGACDDKGCLTAMILALLEILEEGVDPPRTIVLVCAGDEEYAQTGIRHYVDQNRATLAYGIFGEPTRLQPVVQHKGTLRWDITVHGESAHTSRPDLGRNAILGMMEAIAALGDYQDHLQSVWQNPLMTGPLLTITKIEGGQTRNATPESCTAALDFRLVPGMEPEAELQGVISHLSQLKWDISHSELQLMTPPLSTDPGLPFAKRVLSICREAGVSSPALCGEPYGTDAAWVSHLCPAIVLGPGDITYAHAVAIMS